MFDGLITIFFINSAKISFHSEVLSNDFLYLLLPFLFLEI